MWNEGVCVTARCVVVARYCARCGKWRDVESGGVLMGDVECYAKHGNAMWNCLLV